jgi:signal transduction histidine kinase
MTTSRASRTNDAAANPSRTMPLRLLVPFLAFFGIGLALIAGAPRTPDASLELPDLLSLEALLRSPRPPLDGAIYVVGMLGWVVWVWLVVSLALQFLTIVVQRLAAGAAWVERFRTVADWISVPLVRRAVEASLAGSLVVRVVVGVSGASAAPMGTHVERPGVLVLGDLEHLVVGDEQELVGCSMRRVDERLVSQAQATRSMRGRSRVTHFIRLFSRGNQVRAAARFRRGDGEGDVAHVESQSTQPFTAPAVRPEMIRR